MVDNKLNNDKLTMSGDNLHGKQPIKFYSENLTVTKLILIQHHFKFISKDKSHLNHELNHNELKRFLAS